MFKRNGKISIGLVMAAVLFLTSCGIKEGTVSDSFAPGVSPADVTAGGLYGSAGDNGAATDSEDSTYDITVCFAGDVSLADDAVTTMTLNASSGDISDCISSEYLQNMRDADILCLNNEFAYSDRGTAMPGKAYTFRADPARVSVLKDMGVDVVSLANNHVYDFGSEAFSDTLSTLKGVDIPYFGAGENIEEAMEPVYIEKDGVRIAFVGASRAEKNIMTPEAGDDSSGILRCYETNRFVETIKEAKKQADVVLAYVHWGTEYSDVLETVQEETAKTYIDAGADVLLGAHPHCLQGMDYYQDVPILYSLGNFWFNGKTLDTMLVNLHIKGDTNHPNARSIEVEILPGVQSGNKTRAAKDEEERARILNYLDTLSPGVHFDEHGYMSVAKNP